ncbi:MULTISPECIES: DUF6896 domain-containing protein [unclassified Paenibacillus]|uniref:DUF6896 domain-containing protein n=1 Tax=unclassified Paenibacillus TaxID=185978 RepID=UPI0003F9B3A7|nr:MULTISPECIES: hypothetical protein [unclassified Paenibacillus]KGP79042.1 hypothetical protein P364_0126150 [Paenibacillus sp. MAEPY2]KGP88211.1 hypothetical protein P363_0107475 [Paenibacillus sp. MAEPY1]
MHALTKETTDTLLEAMDTYKRIAQELIDKLISETSQAEKEKIIDGAYYLLSNEEVVNGEEYLSGKWHFDVHGEHCMFENAVTGQTLEVSLGSKDDVGNMDPYFFYIFLKSTTNYKHLITYFENPFGDMLDFFEKLAVQNVLIHVHGVEYRKRL